MSKIFKKRVHRNDNKNLPWTFKRVRWVAPFPTTQETTWNDIGFRRVLCFFETSAGTNHFFVKSTESIHHSSCSNPFSDTSLVIGMFILNNSRYLTTSIAAIHLLSICYALEIIYCVKGTVFVLQHLLQPSFWKVSVCSTELVAVMFVWKVLC